MDRIPVQSHLNAHGRKFGEKFYADDTDKTWRLIGVGIWRMLDGPEWWGTSDDESDATAVDGVDLELD